MALPADKLVQEDIPVAVLVQATPDPAQSRTIQIPVTIPPGVISGQLLQIQYDNKPYQISCPPGASAGETITVEIVLSPVTVQPASVMVQTVPANYAAPNSGANEISAEELSTLRSIASGLMCLSVVTFLTSWSGYGFGSFFVLFVTMILSAVSAGFTRQYAQPGRYHDAKIVDAFNCGIVACVFCMISMITLILSVVTQLSAGYCDFYDMNDDMHDDMHASNCNIFVIFAIVASILSFIQLLYTLFYLNKLMPVKDVAARSNVNNNNGGCCC